MIMKTDIIQRMYEDLDHIVTIWGVPKFYIDKS